LEQIALIVIARPTEAHPDAKQGRKILEDYIQSTLSSDYALSTGGKTYKAKGKPPIYFCDVRALDISSSVVREKIKEKKPIKSLVPTQVAEYIQLKGLYT
jgi:nicotinic acid mononucleotide adenylyltransferase